MLPADGVEVGQLATARVCKIAVFKFSDCSLNLSHIKHGLHPLHQAFFSAS
nr:MAG TPA: hypothetical protein [Caudoviricetes sp.]